jgi:S-adenosylmethionine synthetase
VDLVVRARDGRAPDAGPVEVVERKGLGHPDSICDGIAEHVCVRLCRFYLDRFGAILHHNVDKVLLCGGAARAAFGGGEVLEPIEIYLGGRATDEHRGVRVPVHEIAVEACREWLRAHLRGLDVERHVRIVSRLRPGSTDLTRIFSRTASAPLANDTSCGAGFAPLTDLEKAVLCVERSLNAPATKMDHPEIGEDVKVMGIRRGTRVDLTVGCAFVGRYVTAADDYLAKKRTVRQLALAAATETTTLPLNVTVNAGDDVERGDVFLTVTGTSAEAGDDGEVGRGNRASGLITPYRPMTLEAAAGKNPVSHVGKLYNVASMRIAESICRELHEIGGARCVLVSRIGDRVDDPQVVDVELDAPETRAFEAPVAEIVRGQLARLDVVREELLAERLSVF